MEEQSVLGFGTRQVGGRTGLVGREKRASLMVELGQFQGTKTQVRLQNKARLRAEQSEFGGRTGRVKGSRPTTVICW